MWIATRYCGRCGARVEVEFGWVPHHWTPVKIYALTETGERVEVDHCPGCGDWLFWPGALVHHPPEE